MKEYTLIAIGGGVSAGVVNAGGDPAHNNAVVMDFDGVLTANNNEAHITVALPPEAAEQLGLLLGEVSNRVIENLPKPGEDK